MTPAQFLEMLRAANAEQLAEIRSLLGIPMIQYVPQPYPVSPPLPPLDFPYDPNRFGPKCVSGPTLPMADVRFGEG